MQPTFNPDLYKHPLHHDVVLLDKWSIALGRYRRGDVVTLWSPQNPDLLTTKRIVALEGDMASMGGGVLLTPGDAVAAITAYACAYSPRALLG